MYKLIMNNGTLLAEKVELNKGMAFITTSEDDEKVYSFVLKTKKSSYNKVERSLIVPQCEIIVLRNEE